MTDTASFAARWDQLGKGELIAPPQPPVETDRTDLHHPLNKFYKPFPEAADEFIRWAQSSHERIYTGFPDLDAEMRGIAPGEMCLIIGYSHSGKTLALLEMLRANRDKHVIYFVPDEPRTLVLMKLACIIHGVDAQKLEQSIASGNSTAIEMLRSTASEHFPTLAVFDESLSIADMDKAMAEATAEWGQSPDLVVLDYLELLQGGGEDVPSKANTLKAWGRRHDLPLLVLHQTSRTAGSDGKKMSISSGAFGGEQQATHIIGVRRKHFDIASQINEIQEKVDRGTASERQIERLDDLRWEARLHSHTATLNLVKNKRPGGRLIDDMDFEIEQGSGRLHRLAPGELPAALQAAVQKENAF